jgi:hypothetical protein
MSGGIASKVPWPVRTPSYTWDDIRSAAPHARRPVLLALVVAVPVAWLASADGGYFPHQWGWPALGLLLAASFAVVVREEPALGRLEWIAVGALAAYGAWVALSTAWSPSAAQPVLELQRTIFYLAALLGVLLVSSRRSHGIIVASLLAAISGVCAYALATRLFPGRIGDYPPNEGYQLAAPLGYSNGLGILATIGVLLAVGIAAHAKRLPARMAAALALVVIGLTLYFTFSRGALLALGVGGVAMALLDSRRARLGVTVVAVAAAPALAIWLASRSDALTHAGTPLAEAAEEGHRLALLLLPAAALSVVAMLALRFVERRTAIGRSLRRGVAVALLACSLAALGAIVARSGDPVDLVRKEVDAFAGPLRSSEDLNSRLLSVSGSGRADYWRAGWAAYDREPWLGVGAGGYEREWLRRRPTRLYARDAHNLYLETLVELGPLGLALLVTALGVPLAAAYRARRTWIVPGAASAYVAFLVHAAVDWDWELPAVTVTGLLCAAAALVAAREDAPVRISGRLRIAAIAGLAPLIGLAFVAHVGNSRLAASVEATARGDYDGAAADARAARGWAPWSYEPWQRLGEAQLAAGELAAARMSFREALRHDEENWAVWFELAAASRGEAQDRALRAAARLNPRSPEVAELKAELERR